MNTVDMNSNHTTVYTSSKCQEFTLFDRSGKPSDITNLDATHLPNYSTKRIDRVEIKM